MRRQTAISGITPAGSSRALRLDPLSLPVRFDAHDPRADGGIRQIELHRERVVLRRAVRGMRMAINVRVSDFSRRRAARQSTRRRRSSCVHRDPSLSVPLLVSADGDEIVEPPGRSGARSSRCRSCDEGAREPAPRRRRRNAIRDAPSEIPVRRRAGAALDLASPSRRARDHRERTLNADAWQLSRPHQAQQQSGKQQQPRIAVRLEQPLAQIAGSLISSRAICQARCAAKAASPSQAGQRASPDASAHADQHHRQAVEQRSAPGCVCAPNSRAVDLMPISASSSAS